MYIIHYPPTKVQLFFEIYKFSMKKASPTFVGDAFVLRKYLFLLETCAVIYHLSLLLNQTNCLIRQAIRGTHIELLNLLCSI